MIEIKDITDLKEGDLKSYGYFSIGNIKISSGIPAWAEDPIFGLSCWCFMEDQKFKIFLNRIGITNQYLVLSDFSSIPDIAVINSDEILEKLKIEIDNYFQINYGKTSLGELAHRSISELENIKINQPSTWKISPYDPYSNKYYYGSSTAINTLSSVTPKIN